MIFSDDPSRIYFRTEAAAKLLDVSTECLRKWRQQHRGPEFLKFGGVIRYSREKLEEFLAANTQGRKKNQ